MNNKHSGKTTILFLCTGNSCRSQMAEGWAKILKADKIDAYSAGIEKHGLNPLAVKAMAEAGVDIISQKSKTIDELPLEKFDLVITGGPMNKDKHHLYQEMGIELTTHHILHLLLI